MTAAVNRAGATPAAAAPAGPRWTRDRLAYVLLLTFGANRRGTADTRAAAGALGVSQRQVQRWLHGPGNVPPAIPTERLQQIINASRPDPEVFTQEQQGADYAREAIARIALPKGRGVLPAWRERRWLEPHLVAIIELPTLGLRQVAVSRISERAKAELRRRGDLLDFTTVASRFHATALVHHLLQQLDPWRLQPPAGLVKAAPTQTWTADAPNTDISALAVTAGLR